MTHYTAPSIHERLNVFEEVPLGGVAHFRCRFGAHPKPEVLWFKDDRPILGDDRVYVSEEPSDGDDGTSLCLTVNRATKEDEGAYRCSVENSEGVASTTGYLSVTDLSSKIVDPDPIDQSTIDSLLLGALTQETHTETGLGDAGIVETKSSEPPKEVSGPSTNFDHDEEDDGDDVSDVDEDSISLLLVRSSENVKENLSKERNSRPKNSRWLPIAATAKTKTSTQYPPSLVYSSFSLPSTSSSDSSGPETPPEPVVNVYTILDSDDSFYDSFRPIEVFSSRPTKWDRQQEQRDRQHVDTNFISIHDNNDNSYNIDDENNNDWECAGSEREAKNEFHDGHIPADVRVNKLEASLAEERRDRSSNNNNNNYNSNNNYSDISNNNSNNNNNMINATDNETSQMASTVTEVETSSPSKERVVNRSDRRKGEDLEISGVRKKSPGACDSHRACLTPGELKKCRDHSKMVEWEKIVKEVVGSQTETLADAKVSSRSMKWLKIKSGSSDSLSVRGPPDEKSENGSIMSRRRISRPRRKVSYSDPTTASREVAHASPERPPASPEASESLAPRALPQEGSCHGLSPPRVEVEEVLLTWNIAFTNLFRFPKVLGVFFVLLATMGFLYLRFSPCLVTVLVGLLWLFVIRLHPYLSRKLERRP